MRRSSYIVDNVWIDGATECRMTVTTGDKGGFVTVKPYRKRYAYTVTIQDVAEMVVSRAAKMAVATDSDPA